MKVYQLTTYSSTRYFLGCSAGILIGMVAFVLAMLSNQEFITVIIMPFAGGGIGLLIGIRLIKAKADFLISKEGLKVVWTENFKVFQEKDYEFKFINLRDFVIEPWGEFVRLSITTNESERISFEFKKNRKDKDSFKAFLNHLENSIKSYNENIPATDNRIKTGKTFWEGTTAKIIAWLLVLSVFGAWIKIWADGNLDSKMPQLVLVSLAAIFWICRIMVEVYSNRSR